MFDRRQLVRYAWLSVAAAVCTIGLKVTAYLVTGSVGLLSDALESGVNLLAAVFAVVALTVASQPPDEAHAYGHDKAEYLSSGAEGALILIAAATIIYSAVERLINPQPLEQLGLGLAISLAAALLNLIVAQILLRAGRQYRSITLQADAHHLMTDVWTSVGVLVGVLAVALTGWQPLDSIIALLVGLQIILAGWRLVRESVLGLMDTALPDDELAAVREILSRYTRDNRIQYHALRSRQSGSRRFVSVHIQVPGDWSVQKGHTLMEAIERDLRQALMPISIFTHLEPLEDPVSWQDIELTREEEPAGEEGPAADSAR
jgi:cation diffusion facilitator family transporter